MLVTMITNITFNMICMFLMVIKFLGLKYILSSLDLTTQANSYAFLLAWVCCGIKVLRILRMEKLKECLIMAFWLIGKDSGAGRDWGQEEKGTTEDEMAGWHHRLDGRESEWTGVGDGQGGLVCCNSWGHKESDTTEQLNWTE